MKRSLFTCLVAVALVSSITCAGEPKDEPRPSREEMKQRLEMRQAQLDVEKRQAELEFQRQMQDVEVEKKQLEIEQARKAMQQTQAAPEQKCSCVPARGWHGQLGHRGHCGGFMAICGVLHLLLTIWVYTDIRKRNAGSGLWIVITLLSGFFGALLYLLARLGDVRESQR